MCVVLAVGEESHRATPGMVEASWDDNPHGGGIGWLEDGKAKWKKGILSYQEMQRFARELPIPHVLHFRIPSSGGPSKTLCHPFPISEDASTDFEGESDRGLLFHNGTWTGDWRGRVIDVCISKGIEVPDGKWSDTRAMAFIAHHIGTRFLDFLEQKIVVLQPSEDRESQLVFFGAWNYENGIFCSNLGWKTQHSFQKERRLLPAAGQTGGGQTSDSRLPHHYRGQESSQQTSGPDSGFGVRQHNEGCICRDCKPHDAFCGCIDCVKLRQGAGSTRPTQGESPDPTPHLTEVRNTYYGMSKGKLKKLRGKSQHSPEKLSPLEKRIITYDRIIRRREQLMAEESVH